ncbi:hypothetical protein M9980_09960 [Sphingomonas donggukensis]|uniref:Lipoprotein n=1 Tax=Sphingomonas donggukensis TaxID=2949093 RepID=A0ABY4TSI2_9SPHN|nr:hypothetical protein [Sphingomonas donggukensis]URW74889.1 hypothetical protein M9980_09960 [Sphingomonas donggukensis]
MRIRIPATLAVLTLVAACAGAPEPAPTPVAPPRPLPRPVTPPPPAAASSDWRDWPVTPGTWSYRTDGRGSVAMFGAVGVDARFVVRCDRGSGAIYLSRPGEVRTMTVRTSTTARTLGAQPTGGTPAYSATTLGVADPLLDAMGFSRGRFVVEAAPLETLVIPAWAEVLRVVEDCRG